MADILERDAGFCSGGDEDDMEAEDGLHSPTDASEDSVDVKVQAISLRNRNKRKCAEPRKLDTDLPAKKRKIELKEDVEPNGRSPFRPWNSSPVHHQERLLTAAPNPFNVIPRLPSPTKLYLPRTYSPVHQEEPLSLVSKRKDCESDVRLGKNLPPVPVGVQLPNWPVPRISDRGSYVTNRTPPNKANADKKLKLEVKPPKPEDAPHQHSDNKFRIDSLLSSVKTENSSGASTSKSSQGGQQRNYKNMTRERRIEANARERTRVHTISAAFDTLRHSIPAYSHNQKLSKLSVLRIACSYIMTLSRLAGYDYSKDQSEPDLSSCVDNVSKTIQTEGKIRKKKDD